MERISFGLFDWVDRGQRPLNQLYEERLKLIEQADAAGFYAYHLAEHHATTLGMAPSPALFLTAVAQRTRNIRLGPLGYLLPIYDPLRLIEEICMLDQLSNGRLDLGVGRGVSPYELQAFGVDSQNTRAIFDEAMEILVQGLSQPRLNFQGQYYHYDDVPMELEPLQKPYPPMWYPTHNPESIPYVAGNGFNFVGQGPASVVAQNADSYRKIWQQHVDDPNRLNGHVAEPKIGIFRQILVADTDGAAEAAAKSAHQDWFYSITKLWHAHDNHFPDGLFNWDVSTQAQTIIFGSPSRVKEQIGSLLEASHCNYVIFVFAWGTMTYEESQRSMQLFTEEVMPEFVGKPVAV